MKHLYHGISRVDEYTKSSPSIPTYQTEDISNYLFVRQSKNEIIKATLISPSQKFKAKKNMKIINPDEIKEFLKIDKEKRQLLLSVESPTRDVSHLKDKMTLPPIDTKILQSVLPTDVTYLKKVLTIEGFFGVDQVKSGVLTPMQCKKEECYDFSLKSTRSKRNFRKYSVSIPDILEQDRNLGNPTGRQESENLKK